VFVVEVFVVELFILSLSGVLTKMKRSLNILHFSMYLIATKLHSLFNKINPALLLFKIPSVKKRMKDNDGIENPTEWLDNLWTDKKDGFSLWYSGGWLIGIVALAFIGLGIIAIKIINLKLILNESYFISLGIISYIICYFLVFKNDMYLKYFEEFENWTTKEKRLNILSSFGFILAIIILFFISLLYFN
jgi:hypothetical protein